MIQDLVIPARRVAVLFGKNGSVKKKIEKSTKTALYVEKSGNARIEGKNVEGVLTAVQMVKAIGRGFSPEIAFILLKEGSQLNIISLQGKTEKTVKRLMSRVIGSDGRAKRNIEKLSGAQLCVRGKTVSIIGSLEAVHLASLAVEDLLAGRKHAYVYSRLEKMKRS